MFPNDPIFLDFGPKSDLFGQKGPKMVLFYTQKSDFDKNEHDFNDALIVLRGYTK